MRAEVPAPGGVDQGVGNALGAAEPAGGDADAAVPEAGPVHVRARAPDRTGRRVGEADRAAVAAGHTDRGPGAVQRPRVRRRFRTAKSRIPSSARRGHQRVRAPGGPRAPGTVAGQAPAVGAVLRPYGRRSRRPDTPALPARDLLVLGVAELGADRHGVRMTLTEPAGDQVRTAQRGEPAKTVRRRAVAGKRQVRRFDQHGPASTRRTADQPQPGAVTAPAKQNPIRSADRSRHRMSRRRPTYAASRSWRRRREGR